jgi:hypothetical protein
VIHRIITEGLLLAGVKEPGIVVNSLPYSTPIFALTNDANPTRVQKMMRHSTPFEQCTNPPIHKTKWRTLSTDAEDRSPIASRRSRRDSIGIINNWTSEMEHERAVHENGSFSITPVLK